MKPNFQFMRRGMVSHNSLHARIAPLPTPTYSYLITSTITSPDTKLVSNKKNTSPSQLHYSPVQDPHLTSFFTVPSPVKSRQMQELNVT